MSGQQHVSHDSLPALTAQLRVSKGEGIPLPSDAIKQTHLCSLDTFGRATSRPGCIEYIQQVMSLRSFFFELFWRSRHIHSLLMYHCNVKITLDLCKRRFIWQTRSTSTLGRTYKHNSHVTFNESNRIMHHVFHTKVSIEEYNIGKSWFKTP